MMRLNKISKKDCQFEFEKFKSSEVWRFYIDGYRQLTPEGMKLGSLLFDVNEPGYMQAMLNAHEYMNKTFNTPLSPQLIIDIHKKSLEGVMNTSNANLDTFRNHSAAAFGLVMNDDKDDNIKKSGNVSSKGLYEFLTNIAVDESNYTKYKLIFNNLSHGGKKFDLTLIEQAMEIYKKTDIDKAVEFLHAAISTGHVEFSVDSMTHEEIQLKISEYIKDYTHKIRIAISVDNILEAIINLVQNIERLHPFKDGNCRTTAMLLLNRELILNGLPPTMLDNPNRFDLYSVNELKNEIKKGIEHAINFQSDIASLPSFKQLYDNTHKSEKLHNILLDVKDKPLSEATASLIDKLDSFNKGGFSNSVFGTDTKNYKIATTLLDEMQNKEHLLNKRVEGTLKTKSNQIKEKHPQKKKTKKKTISNEDVMEQKLDSIDKDDASAYPQGPTRK